jgi:phenylacetate-CoA ligase
MRMHAIPATADYAARCRATLETALGRTCLFASWRGFDPGPQAGIDERYRALPILTKADIRAHFPSGLVPADLDLDAGLAGGEVHYVRTSGTVDEALTNLWNQSWWDASERASWLLNAHAARVTGAGFREAILASALSVGPRAAGAQLPFESRRLGRFLYLNEFAYANEWPDGQERRMLAELADFRPDILEANPSLLARLARHAFRNGLAPFQPKLITLTYEYASRLALAAIRRAFSSPVASSYGSTETGYVFMECEHGQLHQNTEFCRVDLEPFAPQAGLPHSGRLLVSTFGNRWFPLLRFEIGDLGRPARQACPCGRRAGITLEAIEGRTASLCLAGDGRLLTHDAIDLVLAGVPGLLQYRLLQSAPGRVVLDCIAEDGQGGSTAAAAGALEALFGPGVAIDVRTVPAIAPEPSGKFLMVKRGFPLDAMLLGGQRSPNHAD